jgi:two-component system response regulator AtoC
MDAISNNRSGIVFAKSSDDRDYLRNVLSQRCSTVLCFENEAICFDNLVSIDPELILVRTDSNEIAWRFFLALSALKFDGRLLFISNVLDAESFRLHGSGVMLYCIPCFYEYKILYDRIGQILSESASSKKSNRNGLLVGTSKAIKNINAILPSLMQTSDPVLIEGEPGTGKELLAGMIAHRTSDSSIFIKVNCEALASSGESAGRPMAGNDLYRSISKIFHMDYERGKPITVLLDKIDHLDQKVQAEILLFWEKDSSAYGKPGADSFAGVRFVATTGVDLASMVEGNRFRKELFYRLNVIPIYMPPLRERREDIPYLMNYFAVEACSRLKRSFLLPTKNMVEQFGAYQWPGNVDELKGAMDRLAAFGDESQLLRQRVLHSMKKNPRLYFYQSLDADKLWNAYEIQSCLEGMGKVSLKAISDKFVYRTEKNLLRKALESTNWNRKKAAALLNISYKSMLNKIKMYEIV